ncbi:hypothetical protein [Oceanospirillum sp.]|uniref:hypothetical protein n=1 Tax=Oceanospirillum sp. TaxID=2021254 RepID=UPI003A94E077
MANTDNKNPKMTKKRRRELARELILRYEVGSRFSNSDTLLFGQICGYEFEWVERSAPKIGSAPAVCVSYPAETYTGSWGWRKSIDGYEQRQNLIGAMRLASRAGTFKQVKKDMCAQCGSNDLLAVDHKSVPFVRIAESFIKEQGKPAIQNVDFGWELVDPASFLEFHDEIADYQVLCASCNSKKGAKV